MWPKYQLSRSAREPDDSELTRAGIARSRSVRESTDTLRVTQKWRRVLLAPAMALSRHW